MKILFLTNSFEKIVNGPAKFANLILEINELYPQHQIRIITEDVTEERLASLTHVHKVTLRIPFFLKPLGQVLRMFQYYQKAREIDQEFNADILVYINAFNGLWAAMVSPKPTVGMINDEKNLKASLANFKADKWWFKTFFFRSLEKISTRYHQLIITNSHYLTQKVIQAYQLPESKVKKLYKSVPLSGIVFDPNRTFQSPIRVLFIKADYRVGRLDILAQALTHIPQYTFNLTIIGPEKQFEAHLLSLCSGIPHVQVDYLGPQPQHVVYSYLQKDDILCIPSYTEALGVSNIEGLAHGIAVISTQVGGIPEVLDEGKNGWLVRPNDSGSLAKAIQDCIENSQKRMQQSENGRLFIRKFSKDEMLKNFIEILEGVCK